MKSLTKGKAYTNYRLKTRTLPVFNEFHDMFYTLIDEKYVKTIPTMITEQMCPIVLAHFIMGDGNFGVKDKRVRIYTNHFTFQECKMVANAITFRCGIQCEVLFDRLSKNQEKQYILTIGKSQLEKLREAIIPHMHTSIMYKVGQ